MTPVSRWVTATLNESRAARPPPLPSKRSGRASNSAATSTRVPFFGRASKTKARARSGIPSAGSVESSTAVITACGLPAAGASGPGSAVTARKV